ncbi:MAG TPA: tyrosine-type recombinase/integrase [Ktedonobacteraceae bacterium]|nr:tyrosine-type recombinase/integrase [Ktedonobacteraceae bacterium]
MPGETSPLREKKTEPTWTVAQQRFLAILMQEEHRHKTARAIWKLAGYRSKTPWYDALQDPQFVAFVEQQTGRILTRTFTRTEHNLLRILRQEENLNKSAEEICRLAHCHKGTWNRSMKNKAFAQAVAALGRENKEALPDHLSVIQAEDPEEELAKDIWDLRRLRSDYPKHVGPATYVVDFTWISNAELRVHIKRYFRHQLPHWKPKTFGSNLRRMKLFLSSLPPDVHMGTITRDHVEAVLPRIWSLPPSAASPYLNTIRTMLEYMARSPAWSGPRPPRNLIWKEDIPSRPRTLPRPIPPDVLDILDPLFESAVEAMKQGQGTPFISPVMWDALLILRRTGMRCEDLAHLKAPDEHGHNGCLDQDSEGYWWIRLHHRISKMNRDHRIPTRMSDGVVEAIRRQCQRVVSIADHFGEQYLFRTTYGVLSYNTVRDALKQLAPYLLHEGKPYAITPHQFRHSIATDMIEQGVDIYTVKEFLGHTSLAMTEKYVKVYLSSLKAKYDVYRVKKQQSSASEMVGQIQVDQPESDADGGWLENKVGKLYVSPLPDGIGNCVHLPMHDGCPDSPHCPTCPKLRANKRHLPMWENKATNLLITVEALRANPAYARARQKHEQELAHAEKVIKTIKEEGFWDGRIHNSKTHEK